MSLLSLVNFLYFLLKLFLLITTSVWALTSLVIFFCLPLHTTTRGFINKWRDIFAHNTPVLMAVEPFVWLCDAVDFVLYIALDVFSKLAHSYEIVGLENVPRDRPALLIFYHGIIPVDLFYLSNRIYYETGRMPRFVSERRFSWIPIWSWLVRDYTFPGPVEKCVSTLKAGNLLVIFPGGARETLFATLRYETMWNGRVGFARAARQAGVDIIPVFTRNIRHMFWLPECGQRLMRPIFERYNVPLVPLFGAFPVKLVTHVGKPIPCDAAQTDKELAEIAHSAVKQLIEQNQVVPLSITDAIMERFDCHSKKFC